MDFDKHPQPDESWGHQAGVLAIIAQSFEGVLSPRRCSRSSYSWPSATCIEEDESMSEPQRHRTQEMIVRAAAEVRLCETIRRSTSAREGTPRAANRRDQSMRPTA